MNNKCGRQSLIFRNKPAIVTTSAIVGPMEAEGPYRSYFKYSLKDDTFGQDTFEKTEREMLIFVMKNAIEKANLSYNQLDLILGGDLLNQLISTTFSAREFMASFIGLYSACSTYAQSMLLGGLIVDGGYKDNAVCCTCSHFSSAERQYRFPLELGTMRTPGSQWTVTGAGASVIQLSENHPYMKYATMGKVVDYGISDANNMGAAMAPAALDTIINHFKDTGNSPDSYDLILTGDLGILGSNILIDLMLEKGYDIKDKYKDCGAEIFERKPRMHQGGSGAACSAVLFNAYYYDEIAKGKLKDVLFVATGALLSTLSSQQGDSIPGIAHAISIHCPETVADNEEILKRKQNEAHANLVDDTELETSEPGSTVLQETPLQE